MVKRSETGAFPARLLLQGGFSRSFWVLDPRKRADGGFAAGAALSGAPEHQRVRKETAAAVAPGECPGRRLHPKVRAVPTLAHAVMTGVLEGRAEHQV